MTTAIRSVEFRGGRLPAQPARPHLRLARLLRPELPPPPASSDWLTAVPADEWGMLGNDSVGDCTCAGVAHKRIGDCFVNQDRYLDVSTADVIKLYEQFGYRPGDPDTDQGAVCQKVLEFWQKEGFLGEKILAFAKVDISDLTEVRQAIHLFGQVYCGFNVPQSAMAQFNAGQPWEYDACSPIEGGHCVTVGAYDEDGLTAVTWGALQKMSWGFWQEYFDECWVVIGPDFFDPVTGRDHDGLDLATLEADFTTLTGRRVGLPDGVTA